MEEVIIVITETAYADLEDIENYISQDSPAIVRRFIMRIFDKIDQLYEYPHSGKPVPEFNDPTIKELLLNKYRIIYQLNENTVNVLRVIHGARLLDIEI
ncbi:type II toxin-antitoxin system RelE/ParE family toxin [Mucilaginibacter sp.]